MFIFNKISQAVWFCLFIFYFSVSVTAQNQTSQFKVIAFFTAKQDLAHISFVNEANK